MEEHRRDERDSLFLTAGMRMPDQEETVRIRVRNLSLGGMTGESAVHAKRGERVMIDLPNVGWVMGTVAWVNKNRFGVSFDREIDRKAVRQPVSGAVNGSEMCVRRPLAVASGFSVEPEQGNLRRI
jgi:hypothetical protein